ncbi:MAG TPA: hypothetical protein PK829_06680 [Promineifilum sp.]|nr:hypothetical protein [Promineifilum sp.]
MVDAIEKPSAAITPARSRYPHLLPALFFLLLVLVANFPLATHLNSHVVSSAADDTFEVLWQLVATERAVFKTHTNPFFTPDVFYPHGWYLASGAQPTWYYTLLSPLTAAVGPVATYNLISLGTFVAAGFGVYLLGQWLTGRRLAGVIAGCAYILAPFFTARVGGHTHVLFAMMFLPYALGATLRAMVAPARAWRWVVLGGVALAATILSHWYFLFIATLPVVAAALSVHSTVAWRARLARLAVLGGIALALISPALLLTQQARAAMFPQGGTFRLSDIELHGISPDYYLGPNPLNPWLRAWAGRVFPVHGEADIAALGYTTLALAIAGLLATPRRQTRPFVVMGLLAFVLSLGATLRWRGERVLVAAPPWLVRLVSPLTRDLVLPAGQLPVLLPNVLLYYALPFYSSLRVWARYAAPLQLAMALLAGFGAAWLLGRGRWGAVLAVVLGGLLVLEGWTLPYITFNDVAINDRTVNDWLAARPEGTAIIEYPRPWVDTTAMYSQALHGQSVVNGYMSFMPDYLAHVDGQLGEWPSKAAIPLYREWGIDYVVVSRMDNDAAFRETIWPEISAIGALCPVADFPDAFRFHDFTATAVFAVRPFPGAPCPTP